MNIAQTPQSSKPNRPDGLQIARAMMAPAREPISTAPHVLDISPALDYESILRSKPPETLNDTERRWLRAHDLAFDGHDELSILWLAMVAGFRKNRRMSQHRRAA